MIESVRLCKSHFQRFTENKVMGGFQNKLQVSTLGKKSVLLRSSLSINKHRKSKTLKFGTGNSCQTESTHI